MSAQPPPPGQIVFVPLPPGTVPCPRCGEVLSPAQDWCLNCGDPARTVLAPTPRWRWPLALLAALAVLALGVLTAAFLGLSSDDPPPAVTRTQVVTTQATTVPATTPATSAAPVAQGTTGATGASAP